MTSHSTVSINAAFVKCVGETVQFPIESIGEISGADCTGIVLSIVEVKFETHHHGKVRGTSAYCTGGVSLENSHQTS